MLDMKVFLDGLGYKADGYRVGVERIGEVGVAAVVLLDKVDVPHFVVVSGERNGELLVNDPARGVWAMSALELEESWNGILFVIRGRASLARQNFNDWDVWKRRGWAPVSSEILATFAVPDMIDLPGPQEYNFNQ